jgi:hypothetical protein
MNVTEREMHLGKDSDYSKKAEAEGASPPEHPLGQECPNCNLYSAYPSGGRCLICLSCGWSSCS